MGTDTFFTQLFCTTVENNFHECVYTYNYCMHRQYNFLCHYPTFLVVRWVFAKWTFQETSPQFLPYLQTLKILHATSLHLLHGVSQTQTYHTIVSFNETPTKQIMRGKKKDKVKGVRNMKIGDHFLVYYFVTFAFIVQLIFLVFPIFIEIWRGPFYILLDVGI